MANITDKDLEDLGIVIRVPGKKGRQRRVSPSMGSPKDRIRRVARRAPETMVKITGRCNKGFGHLREHLNYISRNGEIAVETSDGGIVHGRQAVNDVARTWWSQRTLTPGKPNSHLSTTINFMLSMPPGTDRDRFLDAARSFAAKTFGGNYDYLIAEHRDTDHTHVHLTVRRQGHDGQRLNPRKEDLQVMREWLAHELRANGIAAEATPRQARGVVKKSKNQAVNHLDKRGQSRVQRAKVMESVREVVSGAGQGERPWETTIKTRQGGIRAAWMDLASRVEKEGGEGAALAADMRQFVREMPAVETERDRMRSEAKNVIKERGKGSQEPER